MSESFHLYQLQKVDSQLDQARSRLAEIARLLEQDETLLAARQQAEAAELQLKAARHALQKLEDAAGAKRIKREQSEASLYGGKIKNPKELRDLESEVASLKKIISGLEDQQLEAMVELENAESEHNNAQAQLQRVQTVLLEKQSSLMGEKSLLEKNNERLNAERMMLAGQVQQASLSTYDRLRKTKRGVAVARVEDRTCLGCGAGLTPAEEQAARSPHQMIFCSFCGRILYSG